MLLPSTPPVDWLQDGVAPALRLWDLGPVADTAEAFTRLRVGEGGAAAELYESLLGTIDGEIARFDTLFLGPDGPLDLVAFARLVVSDGHYWAERQALHQVSVGRDLVKSLSGTAASGSMVVFGGVDYSGFPASEDVSSTHAETPTATHEILPVAQRLRNERGDFAKLAFTGHEAEAVADYYWDPQDRKAKVWLNRDASESRLKALDVPPRVLHMATHGFFLKGNAERTERPLTSSGLALAGANAGMKGMLGPTGEDGILYAMEALDLNLEGTELVTLSACDIGQGEVDYSEGVYGLVRAFRIAGARNVLMSLWPLNDRLAADFMKDFYVKWLGDPARHPSEALRETRLAWIHSEDPKRRDPRYWAPYVLIEGR